MFMKTPHNPFKQALQQRTPQVGLWLSLVHPDAAEIAGLAGFDWLVIDGEHAPYDLQSIKTHLQGWRLTPTAIRWCGCLWARRPSSNSIWMWV